MLNSSNLNYSSVVISGGSYVPRKTEGDSKPFNYKVIIAIGVCIPIVLIVIIVLVVCCCKKSKESYRVGEYLKSFKELFL